jgi:mycothiol synthase
MVEHPLVPPPQLTGFSWRPLENRDLPGLLELFTEASQADNIPSSRTTMESMQGLLGMLGEYIHQNTLAAVGEGGKIAAAAMLVIPPAEEEKIALVTGVVAPDQRRRGMGTYLMEWLEARARQSFGPPQAGDPQIMRTSCDAHLADHIHLFEQQGFHARRYSYQLRRDLAHPIQEAPLPEGIKLAGWTLEQDADVMGAFNEAFAGHWGLPVMNAAMWSEFFTGVPQFRGDLSLMAKAGEQVAGFCINWIVPAPAASGEAHEGWVEAIGVIPAWRGRGLAAALLAESLRHFKTQGLKFAALDVDAENPTGALRLYDKHGFKTARESIHFVKLLA